MSSLVENHGGCGSGQDFGEAGKVKQCLDNKRYHILKLKSSQISVYTAHSEIWLTKSFSLCTVLIK